MLRVHAHDGGEFDAFCALPDRTPAPGIVLFQEIFGINDNMREIAARLAALGYVVVVPDMFWRIEPRFERNDESALPECMAMMGRFDWTLAEADIAATAAALRAMPECDGTVGAIGFCFGGTLTYLFATSAQGPDAAVSFYGSGVPGMLDRVDALAAPIVFHFGDDDPFIPREQVDAVAAAVAGRPDATVYRYAAGHAFSNADAPSMYDRAAAELAWERTVGFLGRHLRPDRT